MNTWGKRAPALLVAIVVGSLSQLAVGSSGRADDCGRGWVYFDLGNTIVDTTDWDHLKYVPLARQYVRELRTAGFKVGLITNVPESWGATHELKLATLKKEIETPWSDSVAFDWSAFDEILLPPRDTDRKPKPFLFLEALSRHVGCKLAFEGDDAKEVRAALDAGFATGYLVGKDSPEGFFLPVDRIFP